MTTTYTSDACKDCTRRGESDTCADCSSYKPLCGTCDYGEQTIKARQHFVCHNIATKTVGKWYPVECDHHTAAKQRENGKSPAECRGCDHKRLDGIRYYCATTTACSRGHGPKYIPCLDCEKFTAATRECAHGNSTARTVGCIGFQAKLVTVPPDSPSCECAGDKPDDGPLKPAWHLIPHGPLAAVARIVAEGSATHGDGRGWLERDGEDDFRAVLQHLFAWRRGETYDKDSGQHPLAHAAARLLMLADIEEVK